LVSGLDNEIMGKVMGHAQFTQDEHDESNIKWPIELYF